MDWWLLTFFLGAVLSLFLHEVPTLFQLLMVFFVASAAILYTKQKNYAALTLGAVWVLSQAHWYNHQLPSEIMDLMQTRKAMIVEGEVLSLQVSTDNTSLKSSTLKNITEVDKKKTVTQRFNFKVSKINNRRLKKPINVRLSWKKPTVTITQGQVLQLITKLKPIHGLNNLGSFNYTRWLKANKISATGYVKNPKKNSEPHQSLNHNKIIDTHITLRQALFNKYLTITPSHEF